MSSKYFDIGGFRPFDVNSGPNSVGCEWKIWLRSFQLYADGKGLIIEAGKDDNKVQRRGFLLHCVLLHRMSRIFSMFCLGREAQKNTRRPKKL